MKIPEPKKLPSGSYRAQIVVDGIRRSVTASSYKECKLTALQLKADCSAIKAHYTQNTLIESIDSYINSRPSLSPSTLRGYNDIKKRLAPWHDDTNIKWQTVITELSRRYSPKTVKNTWGFVRSVLEYAEAPIPRVSLPAPIKKDLPYLQPDEIKAFIAAIKGDKCEAAMLLALHSLRRSEIANMMPESFDFKRNCFTVRGAAVFNAENKLVHKEANKNTASARTVPIMIPRLAELAKKAPRGEYLLTIHPNAIYRHINKICRDNGLPEVGVHGLRRSFASLAYHLGWSEAYTMEVGGWSDPQTMRKIYIKLASDDRVKQTNSMAAFYCGE